MKNTRANIIKLLEAMENNRTKLSEIAKEEGKQADAEAYEARAMELFTAIRLIESQDFFEDIYRVFESDIK